MADQLDSGREAAPAARPPRIAPITGRPGQTAGESVASALRPRKRATAPPVPPVPAAPPVPAVTAEDADEPESGRQPQDGTATRATEDSDDI